MLDFTPLAAANGGDMLVMLIGLMVADLLLGLLPGVAGMVPVGGRVFAAIATFFETRLNRAGRSAVALIVRGIFVLVVMLAVAVAAGLFLGELSERLPYGWVPGALVLLLCIGGRSVALGLRRGLRVAADDDMEAARALATELSGRDAARLDRFGVGRVVIETASVGFFRRVVTPVFWFILLGFPGLLAARAVSRLAQTVVHRDRGKQAFGAAALALDHALGVIPSFIVGYILAFATIVSPAATFSRGLHFMSLDARRDAEVNDGRIKGMVAGALGLALGGPFGTKGSGVRDNWIGNGRARVGQHDSGACSTCCWLRRCCCWRWWRDCCCCISMARLLAEVLGKRQPLIAIGRSDPRSINLFRRARQAFIGQPPDDLSVFQKEGHFV
jgi:adenosylcobinamide-phosphate synthase